VALGYTPPDDNAIYGMLCERSHPRWAGIVHTLIEPHKATMSPMSDIHAGAFHWDAGYWIMAAIWRMGFRLRYIQAGMRPNPDVAAMLTNLNATFTSRSGFNGDESKTSRRMISASGSRTGTIVSNDSCRLTER
jgi:hypothetical protein